MDINDRISSLIAEMRDVGARAAPSKGGNYNNLILYNTRREELLEIFLEAFENGYRFKKEARA